MILMMTTVPDEGSGAKLARLLVERRLAACVQILPKMLSIYFWNGSIQEDQEHLLLIKTLAKHRIDVEALIDTEHSYDTPEIVSIAADSVSEKYGEWLSGFLSATEDQKRPN